MEHLNQAMRNVADEIERQQDGGDPPPMPEPIDLVAEFSDSDTDAAVEQAAELISERFDYRPTNDGNMRLHIELRNAVKVLGMIIVLCLPHTRYRSLALTALEECHNWVHAAIVRRGEDA